jgi:hypothetical protein
MYLIIHFVPDVICFVDRFLLRPYNLSWSFSAAHFQRFEAERPRVGD